MSTNNQLIILKKGEYFEVHENLCVDNDFIPSKETLLKRLKTLVIAIRFANMYCKIYPGVEYGYYIKDSCLK